MIDDVDGREKNQTIFNNYKKVIKLKLISTT